MKKGKRTKRETIRGCIQLVRTLQRGKEWAKNRWQRRTDEREDLQGLRHPDDLKLLSEDWAASTESLICKNVKIKEEKSAGKPFKSAFRHNLLQSVTISLGWYHKALRTSLTYCDDPHARRRPDEFEKITPPHLNWWRSYRLGNKGCKTLSQYPQTYVISPLKLITNATKSQNQIKKQPPNLEPCKILNTPYSAVS